MECVNFCFSAEKFLIEDIETVYELCLVAECNCTTGEVSYDLNDSEAYGLGRFENEQDFFDKNGLLIYQFKQDQLYHRDIGASGESLVTWHKETNETVRDEAVKQLERYFNDVHA